MKNNNDYALFACPALTGRGLKWDKEGKKITGNYKDTPSKSATNNLKNLNSKSDISPETKIIFAGADNLIIPGDFSRENIPVPDFDLETINNYTYFKENEQVFWKIFKEKPWINKISNVTIKQEKDRLMSLLKWSFSSKLKLSEKEIDAEKKKFIERIFTGFLMDGLFIRDSMLLKESVILELESPGVISYQKCLFDFPSEKI